MTGFFSIKMRASGRSESGLPEHLSGAERIVTEEELHETCNLLLDRALRHECGTPDSISLKCNQLCPDAILHLESLPVVQVDCGDNASASSISREILGRAGIAAGAVEKGWSLLVAGGGAGRSLPGAFILSGLTGEVLNREKRGIRATTMDYSESGRQKMNALLQETGLSESRISEALVLATKVAHAPAAWGELCFSDNPGYLTGYISISGGAYFRIPHLKPPGAAGGRIFYVQPGRFSWEEYTRYLRETPVLIVSPGEFYPGVPPGELFQRFGRLVRRDAHEG